MVTTSHRSITTFTVEAVNQHLIENVPKYVENYLKNAFLKLDPSFHPDLTESFNNQLNQYFKERLIKDLTPILKVQYETWLTKTMTQFQNFLELHLKEKIQEAILEFYPDED